MMQLVLLHTGKRRPAYTTDSPLRQSCGVHLHRPNWTSSM